MFMKCAKFGNTGQVIDSTNDSCFVVVDFVFCSIFCLSSKHALKIVSTARRFSTGVSILTLLKRNERTTEKLT